jgi:hypothetical protein
MIMLFALISLPVRACEPIVPLIMLFGGPSLFARTLFWMGGAVAIKCAAFALLERDLRRNEAIRFMIVANVVSTSIGILLAAVLPLAILISLIPARRLLSHPVFAGVQWAKPWKLAVLLILALPVTSVLFFMAQDVMGQREFTMYWLLKFSYVVIALSISMFLTASWEEWTIARLAARKHGERSFLKTVMRANYVTFAVVIGATAIKTLPTRFHMPGFLYTWFDRLLHLS